MRSEKRTRSSLLALELTAVVTGVSKILSEDVGAGVLGWRRAAVISAKGAAEAGSTGSTGRTDGSGNEKRGNAAVP